MFFSPTLFHEFYPYDADSIGAFNLQGYLMSEFKPFAISTCEARTKSSHTATDYPPGKNGPFSPFEIQDPFGLRNAIVPVFCQHVDGRMYGVGTAFHVDGFGSFLSAHHVVDFVHQHLAGRPILFLSMHALVFGTVHVPDDCFVPVEEVVVPMREKDDPMAALRGASSQQPAIDAALMKPAPVGPGARLPQTLPVRTRGLMPKVGDIVLAIGFPELDLSEVDVERQLALITEGMYGAYGRVVAIHAQGVSQPNPTPVFEIESDWPSGMSGGPVFNREGEVIGMVSRSLRAESDQHGIGYAVHFGLVREIEPLVPNLHTFNPGWRRCWGLFTSKDSAPVSFHATQVEAQDAAAMITAATKILSIANRIGTTDFVEL
ncbi:S1 family peptidase [Xanthomonas hortorum]|uniref:S1 family peptidase n=1 Tax=Xanthomonas hortorum TaxID=56454 RepID=UPI001F39A209|nr:serine protease [Xanthomonas hortorum]MCE4363305.1 serine protease [Xanthomonas hortorum]